MECKIQILLCLLIILENFICIISCQKVVLYSYVNETSKDIYVTPHKLGEEWIALSVTEDAQNITGWGFLEVYTNQNADDEWQAYSAGFVESYPQTEKMANILKMHKMNTIGTMCSEPLNNFCARLRDYLEKNFSYMYHMIETKENDDYWHQVKLFLIQLNGLIDGYERNKRKPSYHIEKILHPLVLMQIGGDMEDLESALTGKRPTNKPVGSGSCSALIKLLPGNKDIYISQDTWNGYESMLRYLKKYQFNYHFNRQSETIIPGKIMTFSSYPGIITSGDDFYSISTGLTTLETTIGNGNGSLWKYVKPEGSVLESIRSMVANRLTTTGKEWSRMFSLYNSGTYNNQWMVIDYKLFQPGSALKKETLYVLEQIPGLIEYGDKTDTLETQGYWASYNVASFKSVFELSGQQSMVDKFGDWFSYNKTARANIFRRDHNKVKDMDSMLKLMRYNNFKYDPLSRCNCTPPYSAENAISARSDLNPSNGNYPFGALGHRAHGGTDSKIINSTLSKTHRFLAVSSPTYYDVPPFQWSKSDFKDKLSHVGHPDLWDFKPIIHEWSTMHD